MNTLVALRAHKMDAKTLSLFKQLQWDSGAERVFMLYDDTRISFEEGLIPDHRVLIVNDCTCKNINTMHIDAFTTPETSMVLFHDFVASHNSFDAIWIIEYDVYCHGSFASSLDACDAIEADFMAKGSDVSFEFIRGNTDTWWTWWSHLNGELAEHVPIDQRVGSFFPMVRYSKRFVEALRSQFNKSTGFCELYCPTLCAHANLKLAPMPACVFGTFRHLPQVEPSTFANLPINHLLYHPIK